MLYALLRAISGIALRWFYSRVDIAGLDRVPRSGPVLLAVNHPNALVDAMVVGWVFPRRIVLTAKATLFGNPLAAWFFRAVGVVPLVRAKDVAALGSAADGKRNARAFALLHHALASGRAVLIFPEGITGDHTSLAPLKTGVARIALQAREAGLRGLAIVPVGLTFERKDLPRTRIFVEVGEPLSVDALPADADPADITEEIARRLRGVTLNFATAGDALRVTGLAGTLARLFRGSARVPAVSDAHAPLGDQVSITRRVELGLDAMRADPEKARRADALLARLGRFEQELSRHAVDMEDVEISLDMTAGARFTAREIAFVLLAAPVALWGRINHWLPFHLARTIARRSVESAADPAMRTIVAGTALVLLFYLAQGAIVWALFGPWVAAAYIVSLPLAAEINFVFRERLSRALRRARAFLRFRRAPELQARLVRELRELRAETLALREVLAREGPTPSFRTK